MVISKYNGACNYSGKRIRIARKKKKLSQEKLAALIQLKGLDINQKAISRIENGIRVIPDYELLFFSSELNVSILWLLGIED